MWPFKPKAREWPIYSKPYYWHFPTAGIAWHKYVYSTGLSFFISEDQMLEVLADNHAALIFYYCKKGPQRLKCRTTKPDMLVIKILTDFALK